MIVQPNFPEHWKTRLLIQITKDESSPLCVLRLWSHCQNSRRDKFPDMTPAQLASVCHWNDRKPACHVALVRAGFVEKLSPKGFAAHQWAEHNAQLLQKWQAGQKGGRPPTHENANENKASEKPTDNRPLTGTKPDKTRPDQTRPDSIDQTSPDQTASPPSAPTSFAELRARLDAGGDGLDSVKAFEVDGKEGGKDGQSAIEAVAAGIAKKLAPRCGVPSLSEVKTHLTCCFAGAADYADAFYKAMEKSHWQDKTGQPINDWKAMAKRYASTAYMKRK